MDMYCIHLKGRTERLDKLLKNLKDTKFGGRLLVVDAVKHENGSTGCGMSHTKIVSMAKKNKMERILVIEDDADFHPNSWEIYANVLNNLPDDWDIITGGISWGVIDKKISEHLVKMSNFSASHFMLYNKTSYDHVLNWCRNVRENIDRYMGELTEKNIKCLLYSTLYSRTEIWIF